MQDTNAIDMSDQALMQRVLNLANRGLYSTQPNPRVGCILVKDGEIIAEAYHQAAGGLHAEREALKLAGDAARGSTAYVNLEPCCHQGRTPPCTDALIDAGVSRVVAAMLDPNPLVEGGGFEVLKMAGIEVKSGVEEYQAILLNRGFVNRMQRQRPWVILKSAATLDGRTAAFDGESKWITNGDSRHEVQKLRASCSAVITGIETVLFDDPSMNVRLDESDRQPYRVVMDSQLRIPIDSRIIGKGQNIMVFTLSDDQDKISALMEMGVEVIQQSGDKLNLDQVLDELAQWQCNEVLLEAGQTLSGAFIEAGLVDELRLFYAGSILGADGRGMYKFDNPIPFSERIEFQINSVEMIESDIMVRAFNRASLDSLQP